MPGASWFSKRLGLGWASHPETSAHTIEWMRFREACALVLGAKTQFPWGTGLRAMCGRCIQELADAE